MRRMIRYADESDFEVLKKYDAHIAEHELKNSISSRHILVSYENTEFVGWLRFNLFWDSVPFMNMLYVLSEHRGKGYGGALVEFWEKEMLKSGCKMLMTSTLSNERAQFFYRKKGYTDCGSLLLPHEPLEIIMLKAL